MSAVESGKQRALLQEAQALSAKIRSLPLDPASLAGSYGQLFDLVKLVKHFLDATAAMPQGQPRAMWEQRGTWLKEEISSLALERVQSGASSAEFAGNLLAMLMAAADTCHRAEQQKGAEIASIKEVLGQEIARLEAATAAAIADAAEAKGRAAAAGAAAERQSQLELQLQQLQLEVAAVRAARDKAEAAAAQYAAEAKEALHNLNLTRDERDRLAVQLEALQRSHRAAAGETHGQAEVIRVMMAKSEQLNRQLAAVTKERDELTIDNQALSDELASQAKVVERLIALNEELMEAANAMAAKQQQQQRQLLVEQQRQHQQQHELPAAASVGPAGAADSSIPQQQQQQQQHLAKKQPWQQQQQQQQQHQFVPAAPHPFTPTLDTYLHPPGEQHGQQHSQPAATQQQQQQQQQGLQQQRSQELTPQSSIGSNRSSATGGAVLQQSQMHKAAVTMQGISTAVTLPPAAAATAPGPATSTAPHTPVPPLLAGTAAAGLISCDVGVSPTPASEANGNASKATSATRQGAGATPAAAAAAAATGPQPAPLPASPARHLGVPGVVPLPPPPQQQQHGFTTPAALHVACSPPLFSPRDIRVLSPKQQPQQQQQQQQQWLGSLRAAVGQQQHSTGLSRPGLLPQAPAVHLAGQGLGSVGGMPSKTPWMPSAAPIAGVFRPADCSDSGQRKGEVQEAAADTQQRLGTCAGKGDDVSSLGSALAAFLNQE